jgi:hypothetical protein
VYDVEQGREGGCAHLDQFICKLFPHY